MTQVLQVERCGWHRKTYRFWIGMVTAILCMYGIAPRLGGVTLRPEKILTLAASTTLISVVIMRGGLIRISKAEALLGYWLFLSFLSSVLSVNPVAALVHTLDLGFSIAIFFIASSWHLERIILSTSRPILRVGILLGIGSIVVALLYIFGFIGNFPWLSEFVMIEEGITRIKMTMWEANLLGAVMMVFSLLSVAEFRRGHVWSWLSLIVCHTGLLLAYSRGPLLGYFAGLLVYSHLLGYRRVKMLLLLIITVGMLMFGIQLAKTATGTIEEHAYMRYSTLVPRILTLQQAVEDIRMSPILGNGTYSFEFMHAGEAVAVGAEEDAKGWIGILSVAVLHDTGLVGFLIFHAFFLIIIRNGYRTVRYLRGLRHDIIILRRMAAWLGAAVGMLVLSISTSAYSLAAFWMVMAIVASIPMARYRLMLWERAQNNSDKT